MHQERLCSHVQSYPIHHLLEQNCRHSHPEENRSIHCSLVLESFEAFPYCSGFQRSEGSSVRHPDWRHTSGTHCSSLDSSERAETRLCWYILGTPSSNSSRRIRIGNSRRRSESSDPFSTFLIVLDSRGRREHNTWLEPRIAWPVPAAGPTRLSRGVRK